MSALGAVLFDRAGTMIEYDRLAPMAAFVKAFAEPSSEADADWVHAVFEGAIARDRRP